MPLVFMLIARDHGIMQGGRTWVIIGVDKLEGVVGAYSRNGRGLVGSTGALQNAFQG